MKDDEDIKVKSELGTITVSTDHFVRERNDNVLWEMVESKFDGDEITDKLHFSEIESVDYQPESRYFPAIIETEDEKGKVPFKRPSKAEEFLKVMRYRWKAWLQNYR